MENKFESIYRVILAFMLADGKISDKEKEIVLEFFKSKFGNSLSNEAKQVSYHKDKLGIEKFKLDAKIVCDNFSREELFEILDFIAKMIKSDGDVNKDEVALFEALLDIWQIEKSMMETFGIQKSLWSKFFG